MSSISYLSMTKAKCREMGRDFWKTEQWNAYAHIRQDLFGFIDAIAIGVYGGDEGTNHYEIVGIQCTGPSGHSEHKKKILANKYAKKWLMAGGIIELWSWRKLLKKKGGKAKVWIPRIEPITLADFL